MSLTRRGFALIELLVATVLSGALAILVGGLVLESAARLRDRSERMALEQALRVALGAASAMLEPLGNDSVAGADLSHTGPSSLVARVVRASGVLCAAAPDHLRARTGAGWWLALRGLVQDRDSLLIASVAGPDRWFAAPLLGPPTAGNCPDGSAALVLPTTLAPGAVADVGAGSPLRVFEPVELRLYASAGASWIGLRLVGTGESIQPLAGPFAPTGLRLRYSDPQGNPAVAGSSVAMVTLEVEARTSRDGGVGLARLRSTRPDSALLAVGLRGRP